MRVVKGAKLVLTVDVKFVRLLKDGGGQQEVLDAAGIHHSMVTGLGYYPQGGHSLVDQPHLLKRPYGHVNTRHIDERRVKWLFVIVFCSL